jgi:hypothetical protein
MSDLLDLAGMGLEDAPEPKVIDAGKEAKLRIMEVRRDTDKNDKEYLMPRFEVVGEPTAMDFTDFMYIPDPGWMDEKQLVRNKDKLRKFLSAFGVDLTSTIDLTSDLDGKEGWATLGVRSSDEFGDQNSIRKYLAKR